MAGLLLGLLDGASALFNPAARPTLAIIIVAATAKGVITGGLIGVVARRLRGVSRHVVAGAIVATILSVLAAIPAGAYAEIIIPGVIGGMLIGLILAKWGR